MSFASRSPASQNRFQPRLFDPEQLAGSRRRFLGAAASALASAALPPAPPGSPVAAAADDLPSPDWTLRRFFEDWFLPVVLVADVEARASTIALYRNALVWWDTLTRDPPLCEITDVLLAKFKADLLQSKFRRGTFGQYQPLSRTTCSKHLKALASILYRAGPQTDPKRETVGILPRAPIVPSISASYDLKPPFSLDEARAIAASAAAFGKPHCDVSPAVFWQRTLAIWFYTGIRSGTATLLKGKHLKDERGRLVLDIPGELVTKTGKDARFTLHAQAAAALAPCRERPDEPLIPSACHKRWLVDLHDQLQAAAGLPLDRRQSPHAWRRTHGNLLAELGLDQAQQLAQHGLQHSDRRTTEASYVNVVDRVRQLLPNLWPAVAT